MAKRRRRRGRRRRGSWFSRLGVMGKIGACLGGVFLCLLASGVVFVAAKFARLETEDIPVEDIVVNKEAEEVGVGFTNVALFGVDSRTGQLDKGTLSDCIIVASLNNRTKEVKMISIYRDTLLEIEDNYFHKCNAAYSFGGPTQAINMLNKNLDLDIQDYVTVDFGAISEIIDLLGGVEITIYEEEIDPFNKFIGETARAAGKEANWIWYPGTYNMDGVQATNYARIRSTAGGDFTRTERQRYVIEKMIEKIQQSDLRTINKIINRVLPTVKTSFSATEILDYAKDFTKYQLGESLGFPFDNGLGTISGVGSVVFPKTLTSNVSQLHDFLFGTEGYEPSDTVDSISQNIVVKSGQRQSTNNTSSRNQTQSNTGNGGQQQSGGNTGGNTGGDAGGDTGGNAGGDAGGDAGGEAPPATE